VTSNVNSTGVATASDLVGRIEDMGDAAWLDLGGGHGVLFLGVGGDELAGLLETNTSFL